MPMCYRQCCQQGEDRVPEGRKWCDAHHSDHRCLLPQLTAINDTLQTGNLIATQSLKLACPYKTRLFSQLILLQLGSFSFQSLNHLYNS